MIVFLWFWDAGMTALNLLSIFEFASTYLSIHWLNFEFAKFAKFGFWRFLRFEFILKSFKILFWWFLKLQFILTNSILKIFEIRIHFDNLQFFWNLKPKKIKLLICFFFEGFWILNFLKILKLLKISNLFWLFLNLIFCN